MPRDKLEVEPVTDGTEVFIKAGGLFVAIMLIYEDTLTIQVQRSDAEEDDNFVITDIPVLDVDIQYPKEPYNMDVAYEVDDSIRGPNEDKIQHVVADKYLRADVQA